MAYGESFRNANLVPGMALGELFFNTSLVADDTQINPGRNPFLRLASDNATAANRTFTLTNGAVDGQILHIVLCAIGATTTGRAQLLSTGNVTLTGGSWEPAVNDTLTLQWDTALATWREVSRTLPAITGTVTSGTYTIVLVAGTNCATATGGPARWIRVGNEVTVFGTATIASTAATLTASDFTGTLPVASNFAATTDLAGAGALGAATSVDGVPVVITGSIAGDVAVFAYNASQTTAATCTFSFGYTVI
jgi:hypothetical protein